MKEYIEREAAKIAACELCDWYGSSFCAKDKCDHPIETIPAADVVEARQIRAFIDRLIAERDKYDLHSMRWEHYDCDRLLIEQMLDEIDGERKGGDE